MASASSRWADEADLVARALAGCAGTGWVRGACPLCPDRMGSEDKRQSLGLNRATGGYHCFRCGAKGKVSGQALDLAQPLQAGPAPERPLEQLIGFLPIFDGPGATAFSLAPARDYLTGRGLRPDALAEAGVGVARFGKAWDEEEQAWKYRPLMGRVIVPVRQEGELVGWVGRDYTGSPMGLALKYRYAANMQREARAILYNEEALAAAHRTHVFVVEGTLDAIALWPDAVAVLGHHLACQEKKLAAAARPVVICFDGDAWREGWALAMKLRFMGARAGSIRLPPRTDPDEVPRAWLDEEARRSLDS